MDFQEPSNWKTSALGYSGGTNQDWEIQAAFRGGPWPRMNDIELLRDRLTTMYAKVKER